MWARFLISTNWVGRGIVDLGTSNKYTHTHTKKKKKKEEEEEKKKKKKEYN